MLLQINNISSDLQRQYYLSWYHNGTGIVANERMTIFSNSTSLLISDMVESDAGKYEVKISSLIHHGYSSSPTCDINILRMLENLALHSPVTFYLQQNQIPQYKPEDIIKVYFLPVKSPTSSYSINVNYTHAINISYIFGRHSLHQYTSRNGESQSLSRGNVKTERSVDNEIFLSHQIRSNNTIEIVGHYVYAEFTDSFNIERHNCPGYNYYHSYNLITVVLVNYWTIKFGKKINVASLFTCCTNLHKNIDETQ